MAPPTQTAGRTPLGRHVVPSPYGTTVAVAPPSQYYSAGPVAYERLAPDGRSYLPTEYMPAPGAPPPQMMMPAYGYGQASPMDMAYMYGMPTPCGPCGHAPSAGKPSKPLLDPSKPLPYLLPPDLAGALGFTPAPPVAKLDKAEVDGEVITIGSSGSKRWRLELKDEEWGRPVDALEIGRAHV